MNSNTSCSLLPLIETISTMQPTGEQAASFQSILLAPDHCGKDTVPALQWSRSQKEVAASLPEKDGDLTQLISVPLLVWGLRQPWADSISILRVVNFWFKSQVRPAPMGERPLEQAWATHAVRVCAQDLHANRARAEDLCREWTYMLDTNPAIWQWQTVGAQDLVHIYNGWLDMGRLALPDLRDLERPTETLQHRWSRNLSEVFKKMPAPTQCHFLLHLLSSDLPKPMKLAAAKKASVLSWLDPDVHAALRPMLPAQDHACYLDLPWTKPKNHLKIEDVIHANESVAYLYCPALQPAFTLMLTAADWTNRDLVCRAANMGRKGQKRPEEFPIGDLVNSV